MLFGRLFSDLDFKLAFVNSLFPYSRTEDLTSVFGTAGAMENKAALKVAIRIGFSDLETANWPLGWIAAGEPVEFGSCFGFEWGFEFDFPNFLMTILGFERRRSGHRSLE